jgi:hypothetical protein
LDGLHQRQGALLVCAGGGEQFEGRRIRAAARDAGGVWMTTPGAIWGHAIEQPTF